MWHTWLPPAKSISVSSCVTQPSTPHTRRMSPRWSAWRCCTTYRSRRTSQRPTRYSQHCCRDCPTGLASGRAAGPVTLKVPAPEVPPPLRGASAGAEFVPECLGNRLAVERQVLLDFLRAAAADQGGGD